VPIGSAPAEFDIVGPKVIDVSVEFLGIRAEGEDEG